MVFVHAVHLQCCSWGGGGYSQAAAVSSVWSALADQTRPSRTDERL